MNVPRIFWPIVITAGVNDGISFTALGNTYTNAATPVTPGTYVTAELLAAAVAASIGQADHGGTTFADDGGVATCVVSAAGLVTITLSSISGTVVIKWSTGGAAAVALATLLGYATAADDTVASSGGASAFPADYQMQHLWTPDVPVAEDRPLELVRVATLSRTAAGANKTTSWATVEERILRFGFLTAAKTFEASATGASTNQALQTFWESSGIGKFRYSPDRANPATSALDYFLLDATLREFRPERFSAAFERYSFELRCGAYV